MAKCHLPLISCSMGTIPSEVEAGVVREGDAIVAARLGVREGFGMNPEDVKD